MLRLDDLEFSIAAATLDAFIDTDRGGIAWGLEVRTAPREVEDSGSWQPVACAEVLLVTPPLALQSWRELAGREVEWSGDGYDEEHRAYRATLSVFDAYAIEDSRLQFRLEGDTLVVEWSGTTDVQWKRGRYDENLPLHIKAPVTFAGFLCGRDDEATARAEVATMFPLADLRFVQEGGVSRLVPNAPSEQGDTAAGEERQREFAERMRAKFEAIAPGKVRGIRPGPDGTVDIDGDLPPPLTSEQENALREAFGIGPRRSK